MLNLTGGCVCGGGPDRPNPDCERCELVKTVAAMVLELYEYRRAYKYQRDAADRIAAKYGLDVAEVRRIFGMDPAPAGEGSDAR